MKYREPTDQELGAYLEQEVTPTEARLIETRLADSASARRRLHELSSIRDALSAPLPEAERTDLVGSIHKAMVAAQAKPRPRIWLASRRLWLPTGLAVAALALFGIFSPSLRRLVGLEAGTTSDDSSAFRARSAGTPGEAERWVGLRIYRKSEPGTPEVLRERMRAKDGLLFAYTNVGPRPFAFLMIFAVSMAGDVYWFYPEFRQAEGDPSSIRIQESESDVELPDLVHQTLTAGRLSFYGLFTRTPLRVSEVERAVQKQRAPGQRLPILGSAQRIVTTEVVP